MYIYIYIYTHIHTHTYMLAKQTLGPGERGSFAPLVPARRAQRQSTFKVASHALSFGSNVLGSCLYDGGFHPLKIR